ncbi:hypothetical protein ABIF63_008935 [Bradyrhizobium japonicum]|uniref:Uncharacterized protein n=1 Tax=Bradyrhizobium japonicum TaxID=375 RepID=A0ABV2S6L6_BRAJP
MGMALTLAYEEAGSRVCSDRKAWARLSHTLGMLGGSLEPVAIKAVSIRNDGLVGAFFRTEHVQCASHEIPEASTVRGLAATVLWLGEFIPIGLRSGL